MSPECGEFKGLRQQRSSRAHVPQAVIPFGAKMADRSAFGDCSVLFAVQCAPHFDNPVAFLQVLQDGARPKISIDTTYPTTES
jgi:hypothetical protein